MLTRELLPCPFCGGEATFCDDDSYGSASVFCNNALCEIPHLSGAIAEADELIAQWNRRAAEPAQPDIPLCGGHAEGWFTQRDNLKGGLDAKCVVCAFEAASKLGGER